mgnify:CR=1 FL=1
MLKPYRTIQDALASHWVLSPSAEIHQKTDRVLRSTKLESSIYHDLRTEDAAMDEIEQDAEKKLKSFSALSQDVFQSFYSLAPRRNEEPSLSVAARKFNAPILEHMTKSEEYPTLKEVCEGRELPAYEAASEFVSKVSGELDDLLPQLAGKQGALHTLEKLERAEQQAARRLYELLEQRGAIRRDDPVLDEAVVKAANEVDGKHRQVEAVTKLIDDSALHDRETTHAMVREAVAGAAEKAKKVQSIIGAWSSDPGNLQRTPENLALLKRVRESAALRDISKYLGRFREMLTQKKQNGYAYGRGEKYSLELGSDLSRALTSELAMLAAPETLPLFLRKYQRCQIKQYRRRELVYKGAGDIICCLDESGSTAGERAAWGKAVAMTLLEIAESEGRRFALIHFSGPGRFQTDVFLPKQFTAEDKLRAAETFLDGGTDFSAPLGEALRLIRDVGFNNADIVFITDGECILPPEHLSRLQEDQAEYRFTITGILLDQENAGMDFSLRAFCQNIYRTSELTGEAIVYEMVNSSRFSWHNLYN